MTDETTFTLADIHARHERLEGIERSLAASRASLLWIEVRSAVDPAFAESVCAKVEALMPEILDSIERDVRAAREQLKRDAMDSVTAFMKIGSET